MSVQTRVLHLGNGQKDPKVHPKGKNGQKNPKVHPKGMNGKKSSKVQYNFFNKKRYRFRNQHFKTNTIKSMNFHRLTIHRRNVIY